MTDREATIFKIGISFTPGISAEVVRRLEEAGVSIEDFFEIDTQELTSLLGLSRAKFDKVLREEALFKARKEMEFVERHGINV